MAMSGAEKQRRYRERHAAKVRELEWTAAAFDAIAEVIESRGFVVANPGSHPEIEKRIADAIERRRAKRSPCP